MTKKEFLEEVASAGMPAIAKFVSAGVMLMGAVDQGAKRRLEMFDFLAEKLRGELAWLGVRTPLPEVLYTYDHGLMNRITRASDGESGK
jgi:hypothetical protein